MVVKRFLWIFREFHFNVFRSGWFFHLKNISFNVNQLSYRPLPFKFYAEEIDNNKSVKSSAG